MASEMNLTYVDAMAAGVEADILLKQGNIAAAERWAETLRLSPTDALHHLRESDYFTYARLLLARKRPAEASTLLGNFERFAQSGGRQRSLITVYILQALTQQALGIEEQAHTTLEKALSLAAPEGYRRAFLDEGQPLIELLGDVRQPAPGFVDQLLGHAQVEASIQQVALQSQPLPEPLSERELEILRLVAEGLSNREIAERAFISQGTVKSHVHNILEKLDVDNRTQAVARARELELL